MVLGLMLCTVEEDNKTCYLPCKTIPSLKIDYLQKYQNRQLDINRLSHQENYMKALIWREGVGHGGADLVWENY